MASSRSILEDLLYRYGGAFLAIALAVLLRLLLNESLGEAGFAVLLIGVLSAAWIGGLGPALLFQTLLLFVSAFWFSDSTPKSPKPIEQAIAGVAAYYLVGAIVGTLSETVHAFRQRAATRTADAAAQRQWLQTTLACMGDGVIATDPQGQITLLNHAAERMTGCTESEALGKSLDHWLQIEPSGEGTLVGPASKVLSDLHPHAADDLVLTTTRGKRIPIAYHAAPIVEQGEMVGVVFVFRDETDRKQVENTLRDADRRKDEFLATLAHELRNPLAPIRAGLEVLKFASQDPASTEQVRLMMERQTAQMVRLIEDLLDVSRITRGKLLMRKAPTTLAEVVENAVEACRPLIEASHQHLQVSLPDKPVSLVVDGSRLTQVISNLLLNAAKFTPRGGHIAVEAGVTQDQLQLEVRDTGQGIPRELVDKIFERFTQIPSEHVAPAGLGIGLSLVKSIVELHQGTIDVQSDGPDRGSCFRIRMPLKITAPAISERANPEQGNAEQAALAQSTPGQRADSPSFANPPAAVPFPVNKHSRRVLVVDDNQDAREMLSAMVRRLGNDVRVACDGLDAVEIARAWHPEIVLMDVGMPRLDGCGAAKLMRQDPAGQRILLVAITGWGQEDMRQRTKAAGFDRHLVKPVDLAQLQPILAGPLESSLDRHRTKSRPDAVIAAPPEAELAGRLAPTS
jgi:PAS domain S-box-containing protein